MFSSRSMYLASVSARALGGCEPIRAVRCCVRFSPWMQETRGGVSVQVVVVAVHRGAILDGHALLGGWWWACFRYGMLLGRHASWHTQRQLSWRWSWRAVGGSSSFTAVTDRLQTGQLPLYCPYNRITMGLQTGSTLTD